MRKYEELELMRRFEELELPDPRGAVVPRKIEKTNCKEGQSRFWIDLLI